MGIELKIKHRNCKLDLKLEHKITVIVGSSATGKSTIHRALTDGDATTQVKVSNNSYQIEYLPNKQYANNLLDHTGTFKGYRIYIIDEGKLDIDHNIAKAIQLSKNIYIIITSRTKLYNLNFDLFAVKELYTQEDGVTVLKNYIHTAKKSKYELVNTIIKESIIEDAGKAKQWFDTLFEPLNIKSTPAGSKEQVCPMLTHKLDGIDGNILAIFDECSFGCCAKELKGILDLYRNRILILSEYKSWEYLILNSNMFKKEFREYDVDIPKFEEGYYEDLLEQVSQKYRYTGIKHDKHDKLSDCYLKPCCPYSKREKCSVGMKGSDKFIAMLENTKFEDLLLIAGRRSI